MQSVRSPRSPLVRKRTLAWLAILFVIACGSAAPGPIGTPLSLYQLKFRVIDSVGAPVYCDPDFYPIAREGGEQSNANSAYPTIRAQADLYAVIVAHEHLPSGDLTDAQKLAVYRAYKVLKALTLTQSGNEYTFEFRARSSVQGAVELVKGNVRVDGVVTVTSRTQSGPPNCPICLASSTMIATPGGAVRVVDIRPGMLVWTTTREGLRVAAPVLEIGSTQVPSSHRMVHLTLADGRELLASPGHETADGRALGSFAAGEKLDGSTIKLWALVPYAGDRTYDLLPAGGTGTYWANGILLSSTLSPN